MAFPPSTSAVPPAHNAVSNARISQPTPSPLYVSSSHSSSSSPAAGPSVSPSLSSQSNTRIAARPAFRWAPTDAPYLDANRSHSIDTPSNVGRHHHQAEQSQSVVAAPPYAAYVNGEAPGSTPPESTTISQQQINEKLPTSSSASPPQPSRLQHQRAASSVASSSSSVSSSWALNEKALDEIDNGHHDKDHASRRSTSDRTSSSTRRPLHSVYESTDSASSSPVLPGNGLIEHQRHYGQRVKSRSCMCIPPALKPWLPVRCRIELGETFQGPKADSGFML